MSKNNYYIRHLAASSCSLAALVLASCGASAEEDVSIIQPGAPGEPAKTLTASEAATIAQNSYSQDDVRFMQDMIPHHQQA
ncbi:MAG: hypothetical protein AAF296_05960, partial [Pseudomonadota bacterium]